MCLSGCFLLLGNCALTFCVLKTVKNSSHLEILDTKQLLTNVSKREHRVKELICYLGLIFSKKTFRLLLVLETPGGYRKILGHPVA